MGNLKITIWLLLVIVTGWLIQPVLIAQINKIPDFDDIGLASMQFFPQDELINLQKIARWTFNYQLNLMKEISTTLKIKKGLKTSNTTILKLGENKILSPYKECVKDLETFHFNASRNAVEYLTEIARINQVRLIVFFEIDEYMKKDYDDKHCQGPISVDLLIFYPKECAYKRNSILINEGMLNTPDTTELKSLILKTCAETLKQALDNQSALF